MKSENNQPKTLDVIAVVIAYVMAILFLIAPFQKYHAQPSSNMRTLYITPTREHSTVKYNSEASIRPLYVVQPDTIPAYFQVSYCNTCAVATKEGVRVGGANYYYVNTLFNRKKLIPFKSCWIVWGWRRK